MSAPRAKHLVPPDGVIIMLGLVLPSIGEPTVVTVVPSQYSNPGGGGGLITAGFGFIQDMTPPIGTCPVDKVRGSTNLSMFVAMKLVYRKALA